MMLLTTASSSPPLPAITPPVPGPPPLQEFTGHEQGVSDVAFSSDARFRHNQVIAVNFNRDGTFNCVVVTMNCARFGMRLQGIVCRL
ncbi:hypothetical protein SSX86_014782 [Deinandra increscens subsp. villosa]|uniref:Uncharacterized protein n=1 Tax=Deinandra increscens subsp. villosa TaxID=3103831 RepID=A0AAP0GXY0_9ASTR